MTSCSQGSLLCRTRSRDLDPGGQVLLCGPSGGGEYIEDCDEMKVYFSSQDRPHNSYLREHCYSHSHRGHRIHSHQLLWLLRSLQREQMYDRDGKAFFAWSLTMFSISLCSVFLHLAGSPHPGPSWSYCGHVSGVASHRREMFS